MHFWSQQPLAEAASTPMRAMAQRIRFEGGCEGGVQRVLLGAEAAEVPLRSALPGMVRVLPVYYLKEASGRWPMLSPKAVS
eukprot:7385232-Prymnesium_polylepis.1